MVLLGFVFVFSDLPTPDSFVVQIPLLIQFIFDLSSKRANRKNFVQRVISSKNGTRK